MIGLFADYKEAGADRHNAYLLKGLENHPKNYYGAALYVYSELSRQGLRVQSVAICPKAQTLDEVFAVAADSKGFAIPFIFTN